MSTPFKIPGNCPTCPLCGKQMDECSDEYIYNIGPSSRSDIPHVFYWACQDCGLTTGKEFTRERAWLLARARPRHKALNPNSGIPHIIYIDDEADGENMAHKYQTILGMIDAGFDVTVRHRKHHDDKQHPIQEGIDVTDAVIDTPMSVDYVEDDECECECCTETKEHAARKPRRRRRNKENKNNEGNN